MSKVTPSSCSRFPGCGVDPIAVSLVNTTHLHVSGHTPCASETTAIGDVYTVTRVVPRCFKYSPQLQLYDVSKAEPAWTLCDLPLRIQAVFPPMAQEDWTSKAADILRTTISLALQGSIRCSVHHIQRIQRSQQINKAVSAAYGGVYKSTEPKWNLANMSESNQKQHSAHANAFSCKHTNTAFAMVGNYL